MKSLYDRNVATEIINRIEKLSQHSPPAWGNMDVAQMLAHCSSFLDAAMGHSNLKKGGGEETASIFWKTNA